MSSIKIGIRAACDVICANTQAALSSVSSIRVELGACSVVLLNRWTTEPVRTERGRPQSGKWRSVTGGEGGGGGRGGSTAGDGLLLNRRRTGGRAGGRTGGRLRVGAYWHRIWIRFSGGWVSVSCHIVQRAARAFFMAPITCHFLSK